MILRKETETRFVVFNDKKSILLEMMILRKETETKHPHLLRLCHAGLEMMILRKETETSNIISIVITFAENWK